MNHPFPAVTTASTHPVPAMTHAPTASSLRVLILEDVAADAELMAHELRQAGYDIDWTRVETENQYCTALSDNPDIVLSDYRLNGFDGLRALELLKSRNMDIPFIMVSGAIGEDLAVEIMLAGARDCISKRNLARLAPAVTREMQQAALRRDRREARNELARQTRDLRERVKEMTCLYTVARLAQKPELPLAEVFDLIVNALVKAYRWPEALAVRIAHGDTDRQTPNFKTTSWQQQATFETGGGLSGSITVCYLKKLDWNGEGPFLPEERLMIDAVAQRVGEIIEDRQLRAALVNSERSFRATFEQAAVGIVHVSTDERYLEVNQKFCDMTGYTREELLGIHTSQIIHPNDFKNDREQCDLLLAGQLETYGGDKRYVRKDGSVFFGYRTVSVARDNAGNPLYYIRVIEDITARKQLEALAEETFEQAAVGIVRTDLDRNILAANRRFCEMTGYTREELLQMSIKQISHPDDLRRDVKCRARLLTGEIKTFNSEKRYVCKDGRVIWVRRTTSLAVDKTGNRLPQYILVVEDVTDRKTAEDIYQTTFDRAPVGIMHSTADRRILRVNPKLCEILGYTSKELLGMSTLDILPAEARTSDRPNYFDRMMNGEMSTYSSQRPFVRKDGSIVWTNRTISLVRDSAGHPLYFVRVIEDISERKRAEDALAQERLLLRTVIDAIPDRIYAKDREGRFMLQNAANLDVHGYRRFEDIEGKTVFDLFPREIAERIVAEDARVIQDGQSIIDREGQTIFGNASGPHYGTRWHLTSKVPLRDASGAIQGLVGITRDITERKLSGDALKNAQDKLQTAISSANVGLWDWDLETNRVYYSREWKAQLGYAEHEVGDTLDEWKRLAHPEDAPAALAQVGNYLVNPRPNFEVEFRMRHKDGSWRWMLSKARLQTGADGKNRRMSGGHIDITERKAIEQALRDSQETFRQLADHIPQVFWMTDAEQQSLVYVSPAYARITGRPVTELNDDPRAWLDTVHELDRDGVRKARKTKARSGTYDIEYRIVRPDRTIRWVHDRAFPITDQAGKVYRVAGISEDITEQKEAEQKLLHMAHYDGLTGLPNRTLFQDRLRHALTQAQRNNSILGVLFIDLDHFKTVNDTMGHTAGDLLLQQVTERLKQCVRSGDTVSRLGGDEFAVILSDLAIAKDAALVAQKIIGALAAPFPLENSEVFVTASVGITVSPVDGTDLEILIRNADSAMYDAKAQGRNIFKFYTTEMNIRAQERMQLETQLRRALERQEFRVYYQPKFSVRDGKLSGFEALLRWQRPDNGLVAPDRFIPLLEETGLIVPVGEWVLRNVCAQIRQWRHAGLNPVPVAINFSARQFLQEDVASMISRTLNEFIISPRSIEIEITESSLMQNPEDAIEALERIKALGIRIAVDDFGTGYSSLNYLKRFPIDTLKIDRSFVRDIASDSDDAAIVRAVINLAHSLELGVIAEGVETREQLSFLDANNCDEAQGYLFEKPMPVEQCSEFLACQVTAAAKNTDPQENFLEC